MKKSPRDIPEWLFLHYNIRPHISLHTRGMDCIVPSSVHLGGWRADYEGPVGGVQQRSWQCAARVALAPSKHLYFQVLSLQTFYVVPFQTEIWCSASTDKAAQRSTPGWMLSPHSSSGYEKSWMCKPAQCCPMFFAEWSVKLRCINFLSSISKSGFAIQCLTIETWDETIISNLFIFWQKK